MDAERWLAAIVESSDDAIIGESLDGIITSWNAGATRVLGYTAAEVLGTPVRRLAWPGEEGKIELLLQRLRRGERVDHFETARRHKDGRKIFVSLSMSPIIDAEGRIVGIAKIARDVTERNTAVEALAASEAHLQEMLLQEAQTRAEMLAERKFRELIEYAPDAILQVTADGSVVLANRTAEEMLGYSREEMLTCNIDLLVPEARRKRVPEERKSLPGSAMSRPMGHGESYLYARRKNGSEVCVEISLSPVKTASRGLVTAVIRDVSERRRSEQEVRELQEGYLRELEARHHEAERLNRLKSEFLASVSHELRTPLHTIIGFSDLLHEETDAPLSPQQRRFVEHIRRDSQHLLSMINDLLDFSHLDVGGLKLRAGSVLLDQAICEALTSIRPYADARSVAIRGMDPSGVHVWADPVRLRQIFYNLLSNAVKFTEPGGEVAVRVQQSPKIGWIQLTVADTGIGIQPEEQSRIFDKFYQVGFTSVGVREGTGLGLAICKQLVQKHGGSVWVESEPGNGSQFHFTLQQSETTFESQGVNRTPE